MVEIEAKIQIDSPDAIVHRLRELKATPLGDFFEVNTFFDTEDRKLLAADQGLRVRSSRNIETGQVDAIITHKGPAQHGQLKRREESEVQVADPDAARRLIEKLGFARTMSFEKRRQSWQFEGCRIELDEIPLLGHFVEIEGPSESLIMRVRESLHLTNRPLIKAGYIAMLSSHLQENADHRTSVTF